MIRQRVNQRLRKKNKNSLDTRISFLRAGLALPFQEVFLQSIKADSFDEAQVASVPKNIIQVRGTIHLDVQAGDTFEYGGLQWQITNEPIVANSTVAVRVLARQMQ